MNKQYIPSFRFDWMIPYYDWLINTFTPNDAIKNHLVSKANLESGFNVLDFGCGTGDLALRAKKSNLEAKVTGIDIDQGALGTARRKSLDFGLCILFDYYEGDILPYDVDTFDRVLSGFVFHHLNADQRCQAFREIYRVLKPNEELHIVDFGIPSNFLMRGAYLINQLLDGFETTSDIIKGIIPSLLESSGFKEINEDIVTFNTVVGTVHFYSGRKP